MNKEKKLKAIEQKISAYVRSRINKMPVPGEGSANAKIIFIGEAPGAEEEKTGRPFVGRSGKLLTELIETKLSLKRKEVYITSVLHWRPPNNRKPRRSEIEQSLHFVREILDAIKPRYIVTLGNTALNTLIDDKLRIGQVHGIFIPVGSSIFFPTYHPAAGIRSPVKKRRLLERDFEKLKEKLS
jgi:DNA polymerase